jgi:hypothetical protein
MLTELRYQVKTHTISKKPREKNILQILPIFFFFFFFFIKTKKMTSYAKARSNLCTLDDANTEKQSLDLIPRLHRGKHN